MTIQHYIDATRSHLSAIERDVDTSETPTGNCRVPLARMEDLAETLEVTYRAEAVADKEAAHA